MTTKNSKTFKDLFGSETKGKKKDSNLIRIKRNEKRLTDSFRFHFQKLIIIIKNRQRKRERKRSIVLRFRLSLNHCLEATRNNDPNTYISIKNATTKKKKY